MVYGEAPFSVTENLVGSTTSSYNSWTGTVADGNNGAYYADEKYDAYANEKPFHRLEVAFEDENGGAGCTWDAARKFCVDKTTDGGGWRLPRVSELWWIFSNKVALEAVLGFTAFNYPYYWSATENDETSAGSVTFGSGDVYGNAKVYDSPVRCVRER